IQVAPKLSVSEGHFISEQVRVALVKHINDISDVTVHIDPEDDEIPNYNSQMPDRQTLLRQLYKNWSGIKQSEHIKEINLHYLDGQIHIELLCPLDQFEDLKLTQALATEIKKKNQGLPFVASTKLIFYIE
ncbi:MAG: cation transporter dimerization domain-containing protein, partial [Thiohalomonadales bacterium]